MVKSFKIEEMTHQRIPNNLKKLGLISSREIQKKLGVSQPTISRLVKSGELLKFGHSFYAHPALEIPPQDLDFATACAKFGPKSAIGGLTALFHYGLIEQAPAQVWVIVPPSKKGSDRFYRVIRTKTSIKNGIDAFPYYRITNLERSVIEAMKFGKKIGERVVIGSARKALSEGLTTEKKLGLMAKKLNLKFILERYWESIII